MTDAQVEAAARELARMRGFDPDAKADYPLVPEGIAWEQFAPEVRRFIEVGTAVATVAALPIGKKSTRKRRS